MLAGILSACGGPTPLPTVGVTVQAFPHVEIVQSSPTPVPPTSTALPTDTPLPPSETPLPTETPAPTEVPPTATALIQLAPPTVTVGFIRPTQPRATRTPVASPTSAAPVAPLTFRGATFVKAEHDPARPPDGSFTTISIEFAGSRAPFTIKHDGVVMVSNVNANGTFENAGVMYNYIHITLSRTCGGAVFGTLDISGGDGQTLNTGYWVQDSPCS